MSEQTANQAPPARRGLLGRIIFWAGVVVWFALILLPGFMLVLAVQGEIGVWHGEGFPDREAHPLLQVKLLMEIDTRGLNITASHISSESDTHACVQTNVNYALWQGQGEPASYCDCYARADREARWVLSETHAGACESR